MSRKKEPGQPPGDFDVGYGRPPKATRFQPGQSGNPKGRRKVQKGVGDSLRVALMKKVTIQENGVSQRITMQEVIVRSLVNDAARGEPSARRVLLPLIDRYRVTNDPTVDPEHFRSEDQAIIDDYFSRKLGTAPSPGPRQGDDPSGTGPAGEADGEPPELK